GLVAGAVAILLLRPERGVVGWLLADTRPRAEFRRLGPVIALTPLLAAGAVRWTGLADRIGEPRAWATLAVFLAIAMLGIVVSGVTRVDALDARMRVLEMEEVHADEARRNARTAAALAALAQEMAAVTSP